MDTTDYLKDTRPWCMGRLLLDRPKGSHVLGERYEFWGYKIKILQGVSSNLFHYRVAEREKELRTKMRTDSVESYQEMLAKGLKSMLFETKTPWLERVTAPTRDSRLWIFSESVPTDEFYQIEGYVLVGDTMLSVWANLRRADIDRSLDLTANLFKNISHRENWEIPKERGFCVQGALIGGPSQNSELLEQTIDLLPEKYALFMVEMRDAVDVDQTSSLLKLLPNLRNDLVAQGYGSGVRVLRDGKRRVADTDAEEVLFAIQQDGAILYRFYLIAAGNPDSTAQPHMEIRLLLGQQPAQGVPLSESNSPVDEATAIKTWDSLLDSLRLRPGAM